MIESLVTRPKESGAFRNVLSFNFNQSDIPTGHLAKVKLFSKSSPESEYTNSHGLFNLARDRPLIDEM